MTKKVEVKKPKKVVVEPGLKEQLGVLIIALESINKTLLKMWHNTDVNCDELPVKK